MDGYLSWNEKTITDFSDKKIDTMYERGYVFTRIGRGTMTQTRSVRIDLAKFKISSENRRVLKKTENINLKIINLPHPDYDWSIGKMGKDFYEHKFGSGIFSANKIKELLTSSESNFNLLLAYGTSPLAPLLEEREKRAIVHASLSPGRGTQGEGLSPVGYCVAVETKNLLHYAYPFYKLQIIPPQRDPAVAVANYKLPPNLGLGMMTKAIIWAKEQNKKYVYLGSAQNPAAIYKLQFSGLEWFDGKKWQTDTYKLKNILNSKGGSGAATV